MNDGKAETFKFYQEIPCADCDGVPIREGSVLCEIADNEKGIVTRIIRAEDKYAPMAAAVGDLLIRTGAGCTRVTNRYSKWQHVPKAQQTYQERWLSWSYTRRAPDAEWDEEHMVSGIMALLPDDIVDDNWEVWPSTFENVMPVLAAHLDKLDKQMYDKS